MFENKNKIKKLYLCNSFSLLTFSDDVHGVFLSMYLVINYLNKDIRIKNIFQHRHNLNLFSKTMSQITKHMRIKKLNLINDTIFNLRNLQALCARVQTFLLLLYFFYQRQPFGRVP